LFLTLDLQFLFEVLYKEFGEHKEIHIEEMSAEEQLMASTSEDGIEVVNERFFLYKDNERLFELERLIVSEGSK
jgi:hypothetical protein